MNFISNLINRNTTEEVAAEVQTQEELVAVTPGDWFTS